jgi:hypothetical protein
MKVIIAGSRDLPVSREYMQAVVDSSGFTVSELVCGMASGVDESGYEWHHMAGGMQAKVMQVPADWKTHGKAAGPIRNRAMAEYADALIAIYRRGRLTPGTRSMISEAKRAGLKIYEHEI